MTVDESIQRGIEYHSAGQLQQAEQIYRQILQEMPDQPDALHLLGVIGQQVGQLETAAEFIERAIAVQPAAAIYHSNLAEVYRQLGKLNQAEASALRAIEIDPMMAVAHGHLGLILLDAGREQEAEASLRQSLKLAPDVAIVHNNLGAALSKQGRISEAKTEYLKAINLQHNNAGFLNNAGTAFRQESDIDQAMNYWEQAVAVAPQYADPNWNMALTSLAKGNFEKGWPLYEWRFKSGGGRQFLREYLTPRWDGADLRDKTIMLYPEQGYGDIVMFARFIPKLAEMGAKVILHCPAEMVDLLKGVEGVSQVVPLEDALPDFDTYQALLSLPMVLKTTLKTLPAKVPYIAVDSNRRAEWTARIGAYPGKVKVGLYFKGRATPDPSRSVRLAELAPLGEATGTSFFSLQTGDGMSELAGAPPELRVVDLGQHIKDFADTAAAITNLDLLITIDTAAAHVAGAIGATVWTMIPHIADFRWMLEGESTPWYPTMRLFRQSRPNDWSDVIQHLRDELCHKASPSSKR
ncbi:MAG TPA: tetratricopeptide repeat protein [Tepidisphaeraceae bacterium]|nr:tetratricopeptide repeat protein [Tepidisphaeraceae bacterium]